MNGDGRRDLVLHFRTQQTGIAAADTEACLEEGTIEDGHRFRDCDGIRIVPAKNL